jgi:hypothetical protein
MPCLSFGNPLALLIVLSDAGSGKKLLGAEEPLLTRAKVLVFTTATDSVRLVVQEHRAPREINKRILSKLAGNIVR